MTRQEEETLINRVRQMYIWMREMHEALFESQGLVPGEDDAPPPPGFPVLPPECDE